MGKMRNTTFQLQNLKGRDNFRDPGADGRLLSERIIRNSV
jgi:hypothetical protein